MQTRPAQVPIQGSPNWVADAVAGLTNALSTIPDGLASAVLAGVDPVSKSKTATPYISLISLIPTHQRSYKRDRSQV